MKAKIWFAGLIVSLCSGLCVMGQEVPKEYQEALTILGNVGTTFYMETDKDAPKGKIVSFDLKTPSTWKAIGLAALPRIYRL